MEDVAHSFLFVSSFDREAARRAVLSSRLDPDLAVISPSAAARETAGYALGDRWVLTLVEPLLAARGFAESGFDVVARFAEALRRLPAYGAGAPLIVVDGLDMLGASAFTLNDARLMRSADDLERALPLP
jgi:broad specificity phosphatase PhoE